MKEHRLVRINYAVRTSSFAYCFLVVALVFWERKLGLLAWGLMGLQFLAYPHLVYLRARYARDSRRAELQNLYLDPLLLGAWMAMLGFPTWVAYAALFSTVLNNTVMRGWPGAAGAVVLFAAGAVTWIALCALSWIAPMGFVYAPGTSALVTALCVFGSLAYSCAIGLVVNNQNQRLRAAREELREGERRYRLITEHAADLVAMVDRDGRWLYASPSYSRVLAAGDLEPGTDAFRNLHEEDQFRVRGALQVVVRAGESCRLRMRLHARGGDVRRFESLVHAVRDDEGETRGGIRGAVIVSRDVTELREREEQLEIAAHAFEQMAEAMMITNAAGRILSVNQAFTRLTGNAAQEVVGRPESDFRTAMQPETFYDDMYAEVLRSGHWNGSTWCRRRDGTLYREWRSVSAVRDTEERITHYVSLMHELNGKGAVARPQRSA